MTSLHLLFGVLSISFLGGLGVFVSRNFREKNEDKLKMKIAIQNSEKVKLEHEEEVIQNKKIARKKKKLEVKILEEKKEEVIKSVSKKDLSALIAKSDFHISRNEREDAEKILIEVLSFENNNSHALEKLGHIYIQSENYTKAGFLYEKLIEDFPRNPNVYTNYGLSLLHQKNFEGAIEAYKKAIELDPENPERYINIGKLFETVQNFSGATENFTRAISINPRNIEYHFALAESYKKTKNFTESKKWYEKILDLSPYDKDAKIEIEKFEALGF